MSLLSVSEAAERVGVVRQRIQERIREGSLPAVRVGHRWAIEEADLVRLEHASGPGRPLSVRSAWDLLAIAADIAVAELSASARSRARGRLRGLLAEVSDGDDFDAAAALLGHALRNRAERVPYVASPRDLPDLRADQRLHLSGVSLAESNIAAGDLIEAYVAEADLEALVEDHLLAAGSRTRGNVVLHVVADDRVHSAREQLAQVAASPLALAADLAEHDGVRERHEAVRILADLQRAQVIQSGPVGGARRA